MQLNNQFTESIASRHLQYLIIQNILEVFNMHEFRTSKITSVHLENFIKIPKKQRPYHHQMVTIPNTMHHNEENKHIMGLWMLITIEHKMYL
jgi:hypothetical protein